MSNFYEDSYISSLKRENEILRTQYYQVLEQITKKIALEPSSRIILDANNLPDCMKEALSIGAKIIDKRNKRKKFFKKYFKWIKIFSHDK